VIVEDFRDSLAGRLDGRAKAMVVTTGRQHALDLYQAIIKWDGLLPAAGSACLIAFSATLKDSRSGLGSRATVNGFAKVSFRTVRVRETDDPAAGARNQDEYRLSRRRR